VVEILKDATAENHAANAVADMDNDVVTKESENACDPQPEKATEELSNNEASPDSNPDTSQVLDQVPTEKESTVVETVERVETVESDPNSNEEGIVDGATPDNIITEAMLKEEEKLHQKSEQDRQNACAAVSHCTRHDKTNVQN
jgi:hypothetical protein